MPSIGTFSVLNSYIYDILIIRRWTFLFCLVQSFSSATIRYWCKYKNPENVQLECNYSSCARFKLLNHVAIYLFIRSHSFYLSHSLDLMLRLAWLRIPYHDNFRNRMSNGIFADIWQLPTWLKFIASSKTVMISLVESWYQLSASNHICTSFSEATRQSHRMCRLSRDSNACRTRHFNAIWISIFKSHLPWILYID